MMIGSLLLMLVLLLPDSRTLARLDTNEVNIFHLIDNALWGEVDGSYLKGDFPCGSIKCTIISTDSDNGVQTKSQDLLNVLVRKYQSLYRHKYSKGISVGLYNIHSWKPISKVPHKPDKLNLPTALNIAESEESYSRFRFLFDSSFPHFDANSTTHPMSGPLLQRSYVSVNVLNASRLLPLKPFETLIRGASFVASTCHRGKSTTKREQFVEAIGRHIRVDSLGACMKSSVGPEGITLGVGSSALENLQLKQRAISHYLFHLAFENTYEPGYVTEKVFDALIAGVVPVFLGSSADCKRLLPSPKAAVFIDDFNGNIGAVAQHLVYLSNNRTAYDEYRTGWRKEFDQTAYQDRNPLISKSWPCRICEWARETYLSRNP
jgi:hypothetical protein